MKMATYVNSPLANGLFQCADVDRHLARWCLSGPRLTRGSGGGIGGQVRNGATRRVLRAWVRLSDCTTTLIQQLGSP